MAHRQPARRLSVFDRLGEKVEVQPVCSNLDQLPAVQQQGNQHGRRSGRSSSNSLHSSTSQQLLESSSDDNQLLRQHSRHGDNDGIPGGPTTPAEARSGAPEAPLSSRTNLAHPLVARALNASKRACASHTPIPSTAATARAGSGGVGSHEAAAVPEAHTQAPQQGFSREAAVRGELSEAALTARLEELRLERQHAEELAEQMSRQAQALLEEKQRLQRERDAAEREKALALERLQYLEQVAGIEQAHLEQPAPAGSLSASEATSPESVAAELQLLRRQLHAMQEEKDELLAYLEHVHTQSITDPVDV